MTYVENTTLGGKVTVPESESVKALQESYDSLKETSDASTESINNLTKKVDWIDPRDLPFGAKMDAYLSDGSVNPTPTDDTAKLRGAIALAEQTGKQLFLPGVFAIYGELEVIKTISIKGVGSGAGYSVNALPKYKQISGFLFKGDATSQKRVRTRSLYRATSIDPQDPAYSVGLNIQAEYVHLEDFTIFLDFDRTNTTTPTNYGANWDIGLFLGCRVHNVWKNVHVLGYWREAAIYVDVTRSGYVNEYKDLNNVSYDRGTVDNGCDGLTMESIYTQGGKWGLKIQGAKPKTGQTGYSDNYYDELQGVAVTDRRGNFGCSDLTAIACSFYGANHHTQYRIQDTINNYLTDTAGGSVSIDGVAGNASGKIQGMYFASCRFSTWEAYRIKLDRVNRVVFEKCHSEGGSGALKTNGSPVLYDDTDYYGPISTTTNTSNLVLNAFNATLRPAFIGSSDYTNIANAGSDINNFAKGAKFGGDTEITGTLTTSGAIFHKTDEVDLRAVTGYGVRTRSGSVTTSLVDSTNATFYVSTSIRHNTDNTASFGDASHRASTVYAATGAINTSDEDEKDLIEDIPGTWLDAWADVQYKRFKFKDAIAKKGAAARWHVGVIAQQIETVFMNHGLDAFEIGLLCYDEWDDLYTKDDVTGEMVLAIPAGSRYSIRPAECQFMEEALTRRRLGQLEQSLLGGGGGA